MSISAAWRGDLGAHAHLTAIATIEHADDLRARRVLVGALFVEARPWQLVHLQWTPATDQEPR